MKTEKVIKKDEGKGGIIILDEGIKPNNIIGPEYRCCPIVYFPYRI